MSTRFHRTRLLALVAILAMVVATGAFSAHGYGDRPHNNAHCDLCVHLGGAAGSPALAKVLGKPALTVRVPLEQPQVAHFARRKAGERLPRGPPSLLDLV